MSTPVPGSGDNLDARLNVMLEALAKASAELERTVNILTAQLAGFNEGLDKSLRDEIQAARERMEVALRQNQDALVKDKESILKTLTAFKQAEIEKVILAGKTVRTGLAAQVEDANRALSATVTSKIVGIKEQLSVPEAEMKRKNEELQLAFQQAVADAQKQLSESRVSGETALATTSKDFEAKVRQTLSEAQQGFETAFTEKRTMLEAQGENVVSELAVKYDEVTAKLETSYQAGQSSLSETNRKMEEKLKQLSGSDYFAEQEKSFQDSINGLSGLLNGLYETRLNNLAAQSRTEIVSAAQHAEECLNVTRADLQACLADFRRDYTAQFEALLHKLEKSLDELSKNKDSGALRGLREGRVKDQLHTLFRRLGQEMIDSAANSSRKIESEFQRSMDTFEQRIEIAKTQACDSLTRESNLMQKELTRSFQDFEKQLVELQVQAAHLEKAGRDAANFVMTIKQANLDF